MAASGGRLLTGPYAAAMMAHGNGAVEGRTMRQAIVALGLVVVLATLGQSAAPPVRVARGITPEQRGWLIQSARDINTHAFAGHFADAEKLARQTLTLR